VRDRTPEEQAAIAAEEAAFRALHPDCSPPTWRYGSHGLTHCCICCPPPPFGPEQGKQIARILADMIIGIERRRQELERRWAATDAT
jgi:hypothetical protein